MRLRLLALAPFPLAILLALAASFMSGPALAYQLEGVIVKALAAAGCAVAAGAFPRRSRLRLAWGLQAACYAVLSLKTLPGLIDVVLLMRVSTLFANLVAPAAAFLMVQAWYGAGLSPAIPRRGRWLLPLLALGCGLALAGPTLAARLELVGKDPTALLLVFSAIGDIGSITLLAPLLLIAIAMRGGRLAWPWGILATGELCWLLYDLASLVAPLLLGPALALGATEAMRTAGCLFYASAGLAQRLVSRPAPSQAPPA